MSVITCGSAGLSESRLRGISLKVVSTGDSFGQKVDRDNGLEGQWTLTSCGGTWGVWEWYEWNSGLYSDGYRD